MDALLSVVAPNAVLRIVELAVILLFSITVHEASHAWMANRCGDDTARLMGRMTLNPVPHIDPIGTILIPGIMILMSITMQGTPALLGWAKPVPVNPLRFKNYHKGEILVSLAGPAANLIVLFAALIICRVMLQANVPTDSQIFLFFVSFMFLNLLLFLFNLIPIPPLDGSHVLKIFLSYQAAAQDACHRRKLGNLIPRLRLSPRSKLCHTDSST